MDRDDGDLMSIVRSCSRKKTATSSDPFSSLPTVPLFSKRTEEERSKTIFSDISMSKAADFGGLDEFSMPFFSSHHHHQQAAALSVGGDVGSTTNVTEPQRRLQTPHKPHATTAKSKKIRKNHQQQKKVVTQVPAESSMCNDNWAWRKYGQKPIKGSPYPRGYYRCSTSKSCPARKQVEKSWADPGTFIITYTGEHNHPLPTHRSSLAGTTRSKGKAGPSSSGLSPTTPLTTSPVSMEDEEGDEEGMLVVEDIEIAGEDELLFLGNSSNASAASNSAILDDDDPFLAQLWSTHCNGNNNSAAAASADRGGGDNSGGI